MSVPLIYMFRSVLLKFIDLYTNVSVDAGMRLFFFCRDGIPLCFNFLIQYEIHALILRQIKYNFMYRVWDPGCLGSVWGPMG